MESNVLVGGQVLTTHDKTKCVGEYCTIHNNSPHHMVKWTQNWRSDREIMERICPHGVGHPDPDDPKFLDEYERVHGCDGCCVPPPPEHRQEFFQDYVELVRNYK